MINPRVHVDEYRQDPQVAQLTDPHGYTRTIGVDLDTHDGLTFTITALRARRYGHVHTERTRHGFHLTIVLNRPIELHKAMDIRRTLGDCPSRLEYDEAKIRYGNYAGYDTLFTWKNGVHVEPFRPNFYSNTLG